MEEVSKLFVSPAYWIGTILMGVFINLATPFLSHLLGKVSRTWASKRREKLEARARSREARIDAIRSSTHALILAVAEEQRHMSRAIMLAVISSALMLPTLMLGQVAPDRTFYGMSLNALRGITMSIGTIWLWVSFLSYWNAMSIRRVLREATGTSNVLASEKFEYVADVAQMTPKVSTEREKP